MNCDESKASLAMMIGSLFESQRVFGKEPEQVDALIGVFIMALADYPFPAIDKAMRLWVKRSAEMPTPFDIVNLIERDGKPPLERAVYVSISKKDGVDRTAEEWQYMRDYERYQLTGEMS